MPRSAETYLREIQRATTYLIGHTQGLDFAAYSKDETLMFAVERNFIIIGEAMACLRRDHPQVIANLESKPVVRFRNFIIHEYWSVDHREVWSTLNTKVAPLQKLVVETLRRIATQQP
jgi:uncharacterized protein with HEPN domain